MSTPTGAVPSWDQVAALAEAIRDGDLTSMKRELLAQLIEQVGTAVRITPRLLPRCPVGGECMAVAWISLAVQALASLMETQRRT